MMRLMRTLTMPFVPKGLFILTTRGYLSRFLIFNLTHRVVYLFISSPSVGKNKLEVGIYYHYDVIIDHISAAIS